MLQTFCVFFCVLGTSAEVCVLVPRSRHIWKEGGTDATASILARQWCSTIVPNFFLPSPTLQCTYYDSPFSQYVTAV